MMRAVLSAWRWARLAQQVLFAPDLFALVLLCLLVPYRLNYRLDEAIRGLLLAVSRAFPYAAVGLLATTTTTTRRSRGLPRGTSSATPFGLFALLPLSHYLDSSTLGSWWPLIVVEQATDDSTVLYPPAKAQPARA